MLLLLLVLAALSVLAFGAELYMPDPALTPGVARDDLTVEDICATLWGRDERFVTDAMKRQVFNSYGYAQGNKDPRCPCEVDHLISRELGGADDIKNLWPQSYRGPWNAYMKDKLENRLHKELCQGNMSLEMAQERIKNWIETYQQLYPGEVQ